MRYMFLIYSRETDMAGRSAAEMEQLKAAHWAVMDETRAKGIFHGAEPLHPTATATTVRMEGGSPLVLDGPFAESFMPEPCRGGSPDGQPRPELVTAASFRI